MEASTVSPKPRIFGQEHFEIDRAVATLARLGAESSFWLALATDPQLADRVYEVFLASKKRTSPSKAAQIMGVNMHGLGPARRHFKREVDGEPFKFVPYSSETLEACRETHVLVAITALSMNGIKDLAPSWGYQQGRGIVPGHTWMLSIYEEIDSAQPKPGWYLIRKRAVGLNRTYEEALALLGPTEFVPSLAVLAQAMLLHIRETGEQLYQDKWAWSSDIAPPSSIHRELPCSIFVSEDGVMVDTWSGKKAPTFGLASATKWKVE